MDILFIADDSKAIGQKETRRKQEEIDAKAHHLAIGLDQHHDEKLQAQLKKLEDQVWRKHFAEAAAEMVEKMRFEIMGVDAMTAPTTPCPGGIGLYPSESSPRRSSISLSTSRSS